MSPPPLRAITGSAAWVQIRRPQRFTSSMRRHSETSAPSSHTFVPSRSTFTASAIGATAWLTLSLTTRQVERDQRSLDRHELEFPFDDLTRFDGLEGEPDMLVLAEHCEQGHELERAAETKTLAAGLAYAARACAACAVTNGVAYAHACEEALGLFPTPELARARRRRERRGAAGQHEHHRAGEEQCRGHACRWRQRPLPLRPRGRWGLR